MSHPYKSQARDNNPKWMKRMERAEGGNIPTPRPNPIRAESDAGIETLRKTPPVTIMEDLVGRVSESKAKSNALRDAIRERASDSAKKYYNSSDALMTKYRDR